jgi:hypothetical protein
MAKKIPIDRKAADRIPEAARRDPQSKTAESGFDDRADNAATRDEREYLNWAGRPAPLSPPFSIRSQPL